MGEIADAVIDGEICFECGSYIGGAVGYQRLCKDCNKEPSDKKASNRLNPTQILQDAGIVFTEHNNGAHLKIHHNGKTIDFWPGTGLYHEQGTPWPKDIRKDKRGVFNLLKDLKRLPEPSESNPPTDQIVGVRLSYGKVVEIIYQKGKK